MERCGNHGGGSLSLGIAKWLSVRGGTNSDGTPVEKPIELELAEVVDGLCQRYSCLPSQVMAEEVGILRLVTIVAEGKTDDDKDK